MAGLLFGSQILQTVPLAPCIGCEGVHFLLIFIRWRYVEGS